MRWFDIAIACMPAENEVQRQANATSSDGKAKEWPSYAGSGHLKRTG